MSLLKFFYKLACYVKLCQTLFQNHCTLHQQARSYVQARGGSCLLVPRRLNFLGHK